MAYRRKLEFNSAEFQEELVRYQNGERENENALFAAIRSECLSYARRVANGMGMDKMEADDIAQEACYQLIAGKLKTYDAMIGGFKPWLLKVVKSAAVNPTRRLSYTNEKAFLTCRKVGKQGEEVFHNVADSSTGAEQLIEMKENKKVAQAILGKLTDTELKVLIDAKWHKKGVKETGESMGRTGNWASGVLHTGRKKIAKALTKLPPGEWPGLDMAA
jgi:RNA polymerase sigma factor (sigma-70 family)